MITNEDTRLGRDWTTRARIPVGRPIPRRDGIEAVVLLCGIIGALLVLVITLGVTPIR